MMTFPNLSHSRIAMRLAYNLGPWVEARGLGEVLVKAGFVLQRQPVILRGPDAAFVRADRVAAADEEGWIEGSPDLAVEVVSPSERGRAISRKLQEYQEFGSAVVLAVDPRGRRISVHRVGEPIVTLGPDNTLEITDLFPGWSMLVAELF